MWVVCLNVNDVDIFLMIFCSMNFWEYEYDWLEKSYLVENVFVLFCGILVNMKINFEFYLFDCFGDL